MKKARYSEEMKSLIEGFIRSRRYTWLVVQLLMIFVYMMYLYTVWYFPASTQFSYALPIMGELFVLCQIWLVYQWEVRYKKGTFLTKRSECIIFKNYALKKGMSEEWINSQLTELLKNFIADNHLDKK